MIVRPALFLCLIPLGVFAGETHWAYEAPVATELPGDGHPVDAFLKRERDELGVKAAGLAPPREWAERAAFTLTGLPPTAAQVERITATPDEATWQAVIDELLASPTYGERWARHWMDVARYSDTMGYNFDRDNRYPYAWTYRDWLIRAFNEDLGWDDFIKLQIAADLIVERPDHPDLAALGFLTVGPRGQHEVVIDDRVDVITRGFMGTTVSCARCHDHKTDPIPTEDYYSFYSILDNAEAETRGPVIGTPPDEAVHQDFLAKKAEWEERDLAVRQALVDEIRTPGRMAVYLELAWTAKAEGWDEGTVGSEGFKRDRARPKAVMKWREFLEKTAYGDGAEPRLAAWAEAMAGDGANRGELCLELAREWSAAMEIGGPLGELAKRDDCPLSHDTESVRQFHDQEDGNRDAERRAELVKLESSHTGAPPRAMVVRDREDWTPARVMRRGNPGDRGEPFERTWLSALGGGGYPEGRSARLSMAEKIADPENPLTARVIVNRVWAWHFGTPLADPGDFGPQQPEPQQLALLDWLAVWFHENGGSLKALHRLLLGSEAYRLAADGPKANDALDEGNTGYWKWNRRRLEFEAMRDRMLASAGALDLSQRGGRPVDLEQPAADLRRSVYAIVDRYELPGLLVNFDLPHPDHHAPERAETTVPQQALWFLNGGLPVRQALKLAASGEFRGQTGDPAKVRWLYRRILGREPSDDESRTVLEWVRNAAEEDYGPRLDGRWEIGYRIGDESGLQRFPVFEDKIWKTGPVLSEAPVPYLSAGAHGGHAGVGHSVVARWRASGAGEVRMTGSIRRSQEGGDPLAWQIRGPAGEELEQSELPPDSKREIDGEWLTVKAGDTLDFLLNAPGGVSFGGFEWDLKVMGREGSEEAWEIGKLREQFPTSHDSPAPVATGDVWADLVQMLWASNEFNYLD